MFLKAKERPETPNILEIKRKIKKNHAANSKKLFISGITTNLCIVCIATENKVSCTTFGI